MMKSIEIKDKNSCLNQSDDKEYVFVLCARDPAAPEAIISWIEHRVKLGLNTVDDKKMKEARECAEKMAAQKMLGMV